MAQYAPSQNVCLAWPSKNHVAASCKSTDIPDNGMRLYVGSPNPTADPASKSSMTLVKDWGSSGPNQYRGFQHCLEFCGNNDGSLCTGCFTVPSNLQVGAIYTFYWEWSFNSAAETYSSCFEAQITGTPQQTSRQQTTQQTSQQTSQQQSTQQTSRPQTTQQTSRQQTTQQTSRQQTTQQTSRQQTTQQTSRPQTSQQTSQQQSSQQTLQEQSNQETSQQQSNQQESSGASSCGGISDCVSMCGAGNVKSCTCESNQLVIECESSDGSVLGATLVASLSLMLFLL